MYILNKTYRTKEAKAFEEARKKFFFFVFVGCAIICLTIFVALTNGNYTTSIKQVFDALIDSSNNQQIYTIIMYSRLPRLLAALSVGAALSAAGWVYQEIFTNRMASPDILGVSSGSGVGASIAIILGYGMSAIGVMAFVFGLASVLLTMTLSKVFSNNSDKTLSMILSGIVIGGLMSSILGFLKYISNDAQLATVTYWLLGGFYNVTYTELLVVLPIIGIGLFLLLLLRWKIMILKNGEIDAKIHGVNYSVMRATSIALATIVTAASVSISGTIGWIGLAIPNFIRILVRDNEKQVLPLAMIYGSAFTGLSDFFARSITGTEIPIGIITGIFGALIFIITIFVRRYKNG